MARNLVIHGTVNKDTDTLPNRILSIISTLGFPPEWSYCKYSNIKTPVTVGSVGFLKGHVTVTRALFTIRNARYTVTRLRHVLKLRLRHHTDITIIQYNRIIAIKRGRKTFCQLHKTRRIYIWPMTVTSQWRVPIMQRRTNKLDEGRFVWKTHHDEQNKKSCVSIWVEVTPFVHEHSYRPPLIKGSWTLHVVRVMQHRTSLPRFPIAVTTKPLYNKPTATSKTPSGTRKPVCERRANQPVSIVNTRPFPKG